MTNHSPKFFVDEGAIEIRKPVVVFSVVDR